MSTVYIVTVYTHIDIEKEMDVLVRLRLTNLPTYAYTDDRV